MQCDLSPFSWMAVWATSGSLLRRAKVTAAFCWTRSQAATSDGLEDEGFSPSSSSSLSIPGGKENTMSRLERTEASLELSRKTIKTVLIRSSLENNQPPKH